MTDPSPTLEAVLELLIRRILREEVQSLQANKGVELLSPEELAERLKLPISWVYEQSRQGNIPTHRLGRYIRFNVQEVIESQKNR